MTEPLEITPIELKQRLDSGAVRLIDCRERDEYRICRIAGADLVPMRELPASLPEIQAAAASSPVVVYCHHGVRSLQVVRWLRDQGVANSISLAGGIDSWSRQVDPSVPRY